MLSEEIQKKLKPTLEKIIKTSDLNTLTLRATRRELESKLNLENKILDNHPYKDQIKTWTDEIINSIQDKNDNEEEIEEKEKEIISKKSDNKVKQEKPKQVKPVKKTKADNDDDDDDFEEEAPKKKRLSLKRKRNVVDDNDDDDDDDDDGDDDKKSNEDEDDNGDDDYKDDDDYEEEPKPKKKRTITKKEEKPKEDKEIVKEEENEVKEESESSEAEDLIEDSESSSKSKSRKKTSRSTKKSKSTGTKRTRTKSKGASNNIIKCGSEEIEVDEKDAVTIEKLKKFVRECGCKKIWSKEFSGCTTANSIIKILKNMLRDLGIEGKPSLAKCKAIATRRELLKDCEELNTNVIYDRSEKRKRNFYSDNTRTVKNKIEDDDDDDDGDEELQNIEDDDKKDGDFMDLSKYGEPESSDDE